MAAKSQPSSSDDTLCLACQDIICSTSKATQCDLRSGWVHINCTDVSAKAYSTLRSMKGSVWLCQVCQAYFPTIPKQITSLREDNAALWVQVQELSKLHSVTRLPNLPSEVASVSSSIYSDTPGGYGIYITS